MRRSIDMSGAETIVETSCKVTPVRVYVLALCPAFVSDKALAVGKLRNVPAASLRNVPAASALPLTFRKRSLSVGTLSDRYALRMQVSRRHAHASVRHGTRFDDACFDGARFDQDVLRKLHLKDARLNQQSRWA